MIKHKIISFGEYIRALREKAELPLRKVAAQLDIDPSLLGKIERNERQPTKEVISGIAKIFNQDVKFLLREYLSDQIAYRIIEENAEIETLKVAEKKIIYFKSLK
ncbi:MAG: helix-turn-helix transcriptional regulator [Bacteroidales bacterium]|nr:helix-turn-helix transcriptional regulator [Bacteroidales bacterium]